MTPSERHSISVAKLSARISSGWMMNEELRINSQENDVQRVEEIREL